MTTEWTKDKGSGELNRTSHKDIPIMWSKRWREIHDQKVTLFIVTIIPTPKSERETLALNIGQLTPFRFLLPFQLLQGVL